jgi:hypothetical protein
MLHVTGPIRTLLPLALAALAIAGFSPSEAARADELLRIESAVTYDVRPDDGPVRVTWQVDLENNDPSTAQRSSGTVFFYESVTLPVLQGASSLRAAGPAGAALAVNVERAEQGPVDVATVAFDRGLYYRDTYAFTLSYDLIDARSDALLITPAYVYVPAVVAGDAASVRIDTPDDPDWAVTVEPLDCDPAAGGVFRCEGSERAQVAALVEVTRPDAVQSIETSASLMEVDLALRISYFPGEEAWAGHIEQLATAALPVLERLFGFPYDGPRVLSIAERGRQDIAGYEGTFGCGAGACSIGISPVADDLIALHELAHLWTEPFEKRWLAEGLAEFMARRAADELGPLVRGEAGTPERTVDLQLDEWERASYLIGAGEEELAREDTGYFLSRRFFELIEETAGLETIQAANAAGTALGTGIDSRRYLDLLEEASGERLDDLFLEHVFPASFAATLEQRRVVRMQAEEVRRALEGEGFELPDSIDQLITEWRFDAAERILDRAEDALAAYTDASEAVERPRSVWARIGLLGDDPDGALDDARASLHDADYARAVERAEDALEVIDGAERAGVIRALIAAAVLAAIVIVVVGAWLLRLQRA